IRRVAVEIGVVGCGHGFSRWPGAWPVFLLISYSVAKADGFDQCHGGGAMSLAKIAMALRIQREIHLAGQAARARRQPWTPVKAAITTSTRAGSATRKLFGARRRPRSTGSKSPIGCSMPMRASTAAGFPGALCTHCLT